MLIESLADLDGDVLLVLAGDGDDEPRLRELARSDPERVRFMADAARIRREGAVGLRRRALRPGARPRARRARS